MTYSLNPFDPFADDEGAVLVVPQDKAEPVTGPIAMFVKQEALGARYLCRHCDTCKKAMVVPEGSIMGERVLVMCPSRHESETLDIPEGYNLVR
jgi:hypothetical protein